MASGRFRVAHSILRAASGGAGCAAGRSVAFGARGSGVRRSGTLQIETVRLSWTDPPLSLLACCTRYPPGVTPGLC